MAVSTAILQQRRRFARSADPLEEKIARGEDDGEARDDEEDDDEDEDDGNDEDEPDEERNRGMKKTASEVALERLARAHQAKFGGSYGASYAAALTSNPALYDSYLRERDARTRGGL